MALDEQQALAIWKSTWRNIARVYGSPGHFGWDWPTLRITFPQRAAILKECRAILVKEQV
jgi:hypothetical protein